MQSQIYLKILLRLLKIKAYLKMKINVNFWSNGSIFNFDMSIGFKLGKKWKVVDRFLPGKVCFCHMYILMPRSTSE